MAICYNLCISVGLLLWAMRPYFRKFSLLPLRNLPTNRRLCSCVTTMRNAWKALFPRISGNLRAIAAQRLQVRPPSSFVYSLVSDGAAWNHKCRCYSSAAAIEQKGDELALVAEIFSKPIGADEIQAELESCGVSLSRESAYLVLQNLEGRPEIAKKFFDWVAERESQVLRSKSYNLMLGILGDKGNSGEFWDLVEIMKKKGFGISKETCLKLSASVKKAENGDDFGSFLKELYLRNCFQQDGRICLKICKMCNEEEDSTTIHKKLLDLGNNLSSELIASVVERLSSNPKKALVFFNWIRDQKSFKIDGPAYNAMAKVLGREDCVQEFWELLHLMSLSGYGMEKDVYFTVLGRFLNRKMVTAAVNLYEFAMNGSRKPPASDFLYLLKKLAVSKDLDTPLITRVVRIFINDGNAVKKLTFDGVLKSLRSVGRLGECDNVLKAMEEGGFVADGAVHTKVVVGLCDAGKLDKACEYVKDLEKNGRDPELKTWASLVQNQALDGELDHAISCFHEMVEKKGCGNRACSSFEALVNGLCKNNRYEDAFKITKEMVTKKKFQPWHSSYKFLIESLVTQGSLKEAMNLLGLMKAQGFPPYVEPFFGHFSKSGTAADALSFLKSMTVKEFPSRSVFLRLFRVLLEAGRHEVAHDILSKSPGSVHNHVDVLDLFFSMKPNEAVLV
ncbi:Pentatricopeptide repeat-containing protein [Apostasia shenzhenica]|uniref:Pentatricopeptide repeat-containing protein n=1 Tax=Apostasia shenzhenica TaxID=1088818 RepID=A0A2I0ASY8_9ASPA|nr:Pentatricopeptide repeat-containing protein [Apostasia shenzhenica]